jgi:5-carboxymethyl-2-hydroxymuconate isomerase
MPHLTIEFSANTCSSCGGPVDVDALVDRLHDAALATGVATVDALRTRAVGRQHYAIGDRHPDNMFVAVTVRVGAGRNDADKRLLVDALVDALDDEVGEARRTMMLSVELQEIDPAFRVNRNHLRLLIAARAGGS